jgi:hypothetical protein
MNKEWYAAWAGKVESVAVQVDPNYKSVMNDQFPNANKLRKVLADLGYEEKGSELTSANKDITKRMEELTSALFTKIKEKYPNLVIKVSAGNDASHAGTASRHDDGQAVDFVVLDGNGVIKQQGNYKKLPSTINNKYDGTQTTIIANVVKILKGFTAGNRSDGVTYLDEYTIGSQYASAPHFHFSYKIPSSSQSEGAKEREAAYADAASGKIEEYKV